ncbi:ankyrin repeat domain-containing protein [Paenibacillus yanchengensis]|uniref:Ankyrin repeat domain-containing protein n=1 Tax=Paenibacillus yanchengensis TaxID=2035833 RepID=A0ABW4YHM6_9BACL
MEQSESIKNLIQKGELDRIQLLLQSGLNPNQSVSCYDSFLECAFDYEQIEIAKLFIENGAILPQDVMVDASRCADRNLFEYLLSKGADINAINRVGYSAFSRALASNNEIGAYALIDLGIDISITGESTLIECAYDGRNHFVELLLNKGVDINYFIPSSNVFSHGITPLIAAVKGNQLKTVIYLIQHGADTTITDQLGCRAYNYARFYKHFQIEKYLKSHDRTEFHDYRKRVEQLINDGLPMVVIKELGVNEKRIDYESNNYSSYLVLGTVFDVVYFEFHQFKLYNLLLELDNFEGFGFISWCPSLNKFVSVDIEHELFYILHDMSWKSFLSNPGIYVDRIIDFEYDSEIETQ